MELSNNSNDKIATNLNIKGICLLWPSLEVNVEFLFVCLSYSVLLTVLPMLL